MIKRLPSSADREPLFIIGDVHGCAQELYDLIKMARREVPRCQIVLLGDLFTKGPDPVGVLNIIKEENALCIKGNHDWALASTLSHLHKKPFHTLPEHSRQTLQLIRYHKKAVMELICSLPHAYVTETIPSVSHDRWESSYPTIIVHAGIDPKNGLHHSSERVLLTARYVKWEDDNQTRLMTVPGAYRQEVLTYAKTRKDLHHAKKDGRFRWHELHQGPELIVFGHDAKQGLFRKTNDFGRPVCVGIDTGCTYGNGLTGYFPELDHAIQVRSKRLYFDIKRNTILLRQRYSDHRQHHRNHNHHNHRPRDQNRPMEERNIKQEETKPLEVISDNLIKKDSGSEE